MNESSSDEDHDLISPLSKESCMKRRIMLSVDDDAIPASGSDGVQLMVIQEYSKTKSFGKIQKRKTTIRIINI